MCFNKQLSILGNMNMPLGEAIVLVINIHLLACLMENLMLQCTKLLLIINSGELYKGSKICNN